MKADFDSEANALGVELIDVDHWDDGDGFDEDYCNLGFFEGRLVYIGLLCPCDNLNLLKDVAESYELDAEELIALAKAALAAPDRVVTISERVAV
ncbi:MAG TPA: hypothetical protein VFJ61_05935 [Solirubrobacterales bacterium]|nr:hypothetical protein [Solirubrobacterales bacterium]